MSEASFICIYITVLHNLFSLVNKKCQLIHDAQPVIIVIIICFFLKYILMLRKCYAKVRKRSLTFSSSISQEHDSLPLLFFWTHAQQSFVTRAKGKKSFVFIPLLSFCHYVQSRCRKARTPDYLLFINNPLKDYEVLFWAPCLATVKPITLLFNVMIDVMIDVLKSDQSK